jgi:hypothetical protein
MPARRQHRADQTNAAGGHAEARPRPGRADDVVDLGPVDDEVRMGGISDLDPAGESVQLDALHLDPGADPLLFEPAGQDRPGGGLAVEVDAARQHDHHNEDEPSGGQQDAAARRRFAGFGGDSSERRDSEATGERIAAT